MSNENIEGLRKWLVERGNAGASDSAKFHETYSSEENREKLRNWLVERGNAGASDSAKFHQTYAPDPQEEAPAEQREPTNDEQQAWLEDARVNYEADKASYTALVKKYTKAYTQGKQGRAAALTPEQRDSVRMRAARAIGVTDPDIAKNLDFSTIDNYLRTKAGGDYKTTLTDYLGVAGSKLADSYVGKAIGSIGGTLFGEEDFNGIKQFAADRAAELQQAEATGEEQLADRKLRAELDRIRSKKGDATPEELALLEQNEGFQAFKKGAIEAFGSIPEMLKAVKENPGKTMRALGRGLFDPRDVAIMVATAGIGAGASRIRSGGSVLAQAARAKKLEEAAKTASKLKRVARAASKIAGEAVVQGAASEAAHSGQITPGGVVENLATGLAMEGGSKALASTKLAKRLARPRRGIGDKAPAPEAPPAAVQAPDVPNAPSEPLGLPAPEVAPPPAPELLGLPAPEVGTLTPEGVVQAGTSQPWTAPAQGAIDAARLARQGEKARQENIANLKERIKKLTDDGNVDEVQAALKDLRDLQNQVDDGSSPVAGAHPDAIRHEIEKASLAGDAEGAARAAEILRARGEPLEIDPGIVQRQVEVPARGIADRAAQARTDADAVAAVLDENRGLQAPADVLQQERALAPSLEEDARIAEGRLQDVEARMPSNPQAPPETKPTPRIISQAPKMVTEAPATAKPRYKKAREKTAAKAAPKKGSSPDVSQAKTQRSQFEQEAKRAAKRGDMETAESMLKAADESYKTIFGERADAVKANVRAELESLKPKAKEKLPDATSVGDAKARLQEGIDQIEKAADLQELDALVAQYEKIAVDAGRPKALRSAKNRAKWRIENAPEPKPKAATPEAPNPEPPAAADAEPSKRRILTINGVEHTIPSALDAVESPASAAEEVLFTLTGGMMEGGEFVLDPAVRDGINASAPSPAVAKKVIGVINKLIKQFGGERGADIETASQREALIDAGELGALEEFDAKYGLNLKDEATGMTKADLLSSKAQLTPAEWGFLDTAMDLLAGTAPTGIAAKINLTNAVMAAASVAAAMNGVDPSVGLAAIASGMAFDPLKKILKSVNEQAPTVIDHIRQARKQAEATGNASVAKAAEFLDLTTRRMVSESARQINEMFTEIRSARNKIPTNVWRKQKDKIIPALEGKPVEGLDPRVQEYVATARGIFDKLRVQYGEITGRLGIDNYVPRIVDHAKLQGVLSSIRSRFSPETEMVPTTRANARDALAPFDQQTEAVISSMVADMKKSFKITKGGIEVDIGNGSQLPASLLMRPEDGKGGFLPPHLPEIFEGVPGSPDVFVKSRPEGVGAEWKWEGDDGLDAVLRREAVRLLTEMWDPDEAFAGRALPRSQKARRWQMDGSLIHRRVMPDMGPGVYVDDIEDILAHTVDRQTRGIMRLKHFGRENFDAYSPRELEARNAAAATGRPFPRKMSHKGLLEDALKTMSKAMPKKDLGLVDESGQTRLAASNEDAFKASLLRSIEDAAMGYLRPFSPMEFMNSERLFRAVSGTNKIARILAMTTRTLNAARNEVQGLAQSYSAGGKKSLRRYTRARADVAAQTAIESAKRTIASVIDAGGYGFAEAAAKLRNSPMTDYYLSRGAGDAAGRLGKDRFERGMHAMEQLIGTFGPSNQAADMAAHAAGVDLALDALEEIKKTQKTGGWKLSEKARKAMGDSPEGELAEWLRKTIGDDNVESALMLVDDNGGPVNEAALESVMQIVAPFVDDYRSQVTGSNEALFQTKLFRNRSFKLTLGQMASVPIALTARMIQQLKEEPTIPRKIRRVRRQATAAVAGGAGLTAIAANPMQSMLAVAAMNGSVAPLLATAILMENLGTGGDEYRRNSEKKADDNLQELAMQLGSADVTGLMAKMTGYALQGAPMSIQAMNMAADQFIAMSPEEARTAGISTFGQNSLADYGKLVIPGFSVPAQIVGTGIRRASKETGAFNKSRAALSAIPWVNDLVGGWYDAAGKDPMLRAQSKIDALPKKAEAIANPMFRNRSLTKLQSKIDAMNARKR